MKRLSRKKAIHFFVCKFIHQDSRSIIWFRDISVSPSFSVIFCLLFVPCLFLCGRAPIYLLFINRIDWYSLMYVYSKRYCGNMNSWITKTDNLTGPHPIRTRSKPWNWVLRSALRKIMSTYCANNADERSFFDKNLCVQSYMGL